MSKVANIVMRSSNPACGATVYPQSPTLTITDDYGSSVVPVEETDSVKGRRIFRQFNKHSYNALQERERILAQKKSTEIPKRFQEGRLVDGVLKFGDLDNDDDVPDFDPELVEGRNLPERLARLIPDDYMTKPLEEIDPYIMDKSFVVITNRFKRKFIHRFAATKSCILLSPWNPVRRAAILLYTNQFFDYCIISTILINCIFLALPEYSFKDKAEYCFLAIYTFEAIIKIAARGFVLYKFTYLRDAWNWLDFLVIISAFVTMIIELSTGSKDAFGNLTGLRTFRVLRALRTVSIVPGLKTIIGALLKSLKMLTDVILLTVFCMMIFALFAVQVYIGVLRQKCVKNIVGVTLNDFDYMTYIKDETKWLHDGDNYVICGNATGSGHCPKNYTCLPDIGDNPNFGYTSFDHFGWAMLNSFQLITLDFWEDIYNKVIRANGPWNIVFFIIVIFFGSFYLINLMLAVVSMSYEEEAISLVELERKKEPEKKEKVASNTEITSMDGENATRLQVFKSFMNASRTSFNSTANDDYELKSYSEKPTSQTGCEGGDVPIEKSIVSGLLNLLPASDDKNDDDDISVYSTDGNEPRIIVANDYGDHDLVDRNCSCCSSICNCFIGWLMLQNRLHSVVSDFIFELFITFCIILNVITMSIEHHGMSDELAKMLRYANYVFTAIFTLECIAKLVAMTKHYFNTAWNIFDFVIVLASLVDLGLEDIDGLSVFRGFRLLRLLRVFKLAQTWSTMRVLLSIILSTLSALGNLTFILVIVIYIFAIIGMQLFSKSYTPDKFGTEFIPRWNFTNFFHSLFLIFRILCGEWVESLWDCMRANGEICMLVFLPTLVFGNFMVLNLFLALLLNSFATDDIKNKNTATPGENNKVRQGWERLKNVFKHKQMRSVKPEPSMVVIVNELRKKSNFNDGIANHQDENNSLADNDPVSKSPSKEFKEEPVAEKFKEPKDMSGDDDNDDDVKKEIVVQDCFPKSCYSRCDVWCLDFGETEFGRKLAMIRLNVSQFTEHKAFEYFILFIIFASSVSLCFEDIYLDDKPVLKNILRYLNYVYAGIFTIEMLLKWVGLGFKVYFTNFWTILDFCIVIISLLSLLAESLGLDKLSSFRSLRTLRALRPLRAISRWQGMKIVVNALMYAIPSIFNVLLVCLVFWLIFSIAGVQLFGGKFYKCLDPQGNRPKAIEIPNRTECEKRIHLGYKWENSKINFDHIFQGYLALFQVATFEGWMEVMDDASDSTGVDIQPSREANFYSLWYFIIFIICGSFFTLNLFIGVIIDNFNTLKKKYEGGALDMFLTSSQRDYYNTMRKISMKKPQKTIRRPKNKIQAFFFDVSMSNKFELAIVILIFLNMICMAVEHYKQSKVYNEALDILNMIFTSIFTCEAAVKIFGLRWHYFRKGWNIFDFIIVVLSILGIVMGDILSRVIITPTLLRVIRVFRIGRVLRLIKAAKGIRKLLFALVISLPALLNIGMLLFLIVFIYAIFGMVSFGRIKQTGILDDVVNFQTFGSSLVLLFRLTTSAGWNDVLEPLMISGDDCDSKYWTHPNGTKIVSTGGDCGSRIIAIIFMVTFIFITFLIIINMYIAVILENFNQAHQQEEVGVTEDDFEMFYIFWEQYDPHASQFLKYEQLSSFLADLDPPLGIPKPNELAMVALDLPIYEGERLHCLDILSALVRHVLGNVDLNDAEFSALLKSHVTKKHEDAFPTRVRHAVLSTTMQRKKEDVAAKTLQRAWRKHRATMNILRITELALEQHLSHTLTRSSFSTLLPSRAASAASFSSAKSRRPSVTLRADDIAREKRLARAAVKLPSASEIIKEPNESLV